MHEPELLILDEPTVAVDPILRANIWNYMVRETEEKKISIIITTHYIEEARQAQTIGLMRNGELLAEDAPEQLLITFGCSTLEDVFLKLSRQQDISIKQQPPTRNIEEKFKKRDKNEAIEGNSESYEGLVEKVDHQIAHTLKRDIAAAFENFTQDLMEECGIESRLFKLPMSTEAVYGSNRPSFTTFAAPGVLLT
nr:unnamed protein product [Callosobruchus chinensis]